MSSIVLKNIIVSDLPKDIVIEGGLIQKIAPAGSIESSAGAEVVDCSGRVAIPSFINMHTHAAMSLMRGTGEDMCFDKWIRHIWEIEEGVDEEYVYQGSRVACLEMAKTGTSTYNDMYMLAPYTRKATTEVGLRGVLSYVILDNFDKEVAAQKRDICQEIYEKFSQQDGGLSTFAIAPHAVYTVSEENLLWSKEFARKHGLPYHIHLSETLKEVEECKAAHGGLTPIEYCDRLGILDSNTISAHSLWLTENDIEILGKRQVSCVHNINSNLKLISGLEFKYNELRDAGANVCIGTDGCASSNNLDMLEAMKNSALVQKCWRQDAESMPLAELMDMATVNAAKALNIKAGKIEEGYLADISIVNVDSTFFLSDGPFLANLIYSAHSDCIESLIVGGKFVMRERKVEGEKEILRDARQMLNNIKNR